ncbi:Putative formate/nitrite transporter, aquaporin [Septoria linicola]|uniref:Formate/nitrite transporter, aquaporin n=1 Tax=Septoria linicola TaxID=215465 RepID=A0A9Q9EN38_9PEZI|nr:putative formate/nitrite transporter, aquaporin [Septoria linicola]USW57391.1 Putative formate/nitrite transporter, aquaporin [Septoria linicola]
MSSSTNGFSPQEISHLITTAGLAKSRLTWPEYIIKSFFGGFFISFGGMIDLIIVAGSPSLRSSNPALATLIGGFLFPLGFVLVTLTNMELCTSKYVCHAVHDSAEKDDSVGFVQELGSDTDEAVAYAVSQAEGRVNVKWSVNFLRGVGCNFLVRMAFFMSLGSVEFVSKVYTIWIPVWAFVIAGYQHSIANYFMVPIGMFYGVNFSVGKFIYQSIIPATLGNIVGGALLGAVPFWYLYGRGEPANVQTGHVVQGQDEHKHRVDSEETIGRQEQDRRSDHRASTDRYDRNGTVDAA